MFLFLDIQKLFIRRQKQACCSKQDHSYLSVALGHTTPYAEQVMTIPQPTLRQQLDQLLNPQEGSGLKEHLFTIFLTMMILISVAITIVDTVPEIHQQYGHVFRLFDYLCAIIFTAEFIGRLYVAPLKSQFQGHKGFLRYLLSPFTIIDLLVILSLIAPGITALASFRGLRLIKLLSVLKIGRYSKSVQLIGRVLAQRANELITTVIIVVVLVFIAASVLYQIESAAGTEGFESIPNALWWAVVTLTTTGYGDVYPATVLGKIAAGFIMLFGIGMVALPAGMVASGFAEELANMKQKRRENEKPFKYCPHCGEKLSD